MGIDSYDSITIAKTQLSTAIRLYFEGQDLFSVITLAGAAEEILGKHLDRNGIENSFQNMKKALLAVHKILFDDEELLEKEAVRRINLAKTSTKHIGDEDPVSLDLIEEAQDMLQRAVDNYWLLFNDSTPEIDAFERSLRDV